MSMTVTMKKVARRAGVSVSTVSRVLAGHANVRAETSRRVRETMEELGYTPNIIAQNLVSRTTRCICVLLPDTAEIWPANLYCMEVIRGIVLGAGKLGYDIQLASGDGGREELEAVSRLLKGGRADGAILLSARRSSSVVDFLQQEGYPFVLVEDEPTAGSGSEGAGDQHETDAGSSGQTKVGRESSDEGAGALASAVVTFPGIPDESVARMGAMASELLIGSIRRQHQQQSSGGDAGWMAQFVLRRPVLRG